MGARRGQSTVELMFMIPVIFGLLFAVVELAFWLGGTHFVTYAAFAGARAQQVGRDAEEATAALLDGRATRSQSTSADGQSVTVYMPWAFDLPFVSAVGDVDYDVSVTAGPDEFQYEGRSGDRAWRYGDNNCPSGGC
jgi:hypothetical protein